MSNTQTSSQHEQNRSEGYMHYFGGRQRVQTNTHQQRSAVGDTISPKIFTAAIEEGGFKKLNLEKNGVTAQHATERKNVTHYII